MSIEAGELRASAGPEAPELDVVDQVEDLVVDDVDEATETFEQTSLPGLESAAPAIAATEDPGASDGEPQPRGDVRKASGGFFQFTLEAADRLHDHFPVTVTLPNRERRKHQKLTLRSARDIYGAFAEVGNEKRAGASWFEKRREAIAAIAGVGVRTLDLYVAEFVKIGLLERRRRRRSGGRHDPNLWRLPLHARADLRGAASDAPGDSGAQPATPQAGLRGAASDAQLKKDGIEGNVVQFPPGRRGRDTGRLSTAERRRRAMLKVYGGEAL